jgi:hypothetical protein
MIRSMTGAAAFLALSAIGAAQEMPLRTWDEVHEKCSEFVAGRLKDPASRPFLIKRCMKGVLCRMKANGRAKEYDLSPKEWQNAIEACVAGEQA